MQLFPPECDLGAPPGWSRECEQLPLPPEAGVVQEPSPARAGPWASGSLSVAGSGCASDGLLQCPQLLSPPGLDRGVRGGPDRPLSSRQPPTRARPVLGAGRWAGGRGDRIQPSLATCRVPTVAAALLLTPPGDPKSPSLSGVPLIRTASEEGRISRGAPLHACDPGLALPPPPGPQGSGGRDEASSTLLRLIRVDRSRCGSSGICWCELRGGVPHQAPQRAPLGSSHRPLLGLAGGFPRRPLRRGCSSPLDLWDSPSVSGTTFHKKGEELGHVREKT
eukprot:XP_016868388.1 uncharacterized protein LOC105375303 [Homo sapiens]